MQDEHDLLFDSLTAPGVRINKLKLSDFPETGRGLAATQAIRKDEILLTIPSKYLLNLKVVGKEFGFDWRKPPVPAHVALALYILHHELRPESSLRAYIDSLPRNFETVPLTWNKQHVDDLPLYTKAYLEKQNTVFDRHFATAQWMIRKILPLESHPDIDLTNISREKFLWAWLVVNSRCIYQKLSATSTRDDNYACSPLIDMINHAPASITHCKLSYDIKGLSVISTSSYRAGQELFISYGAHANDALLCEYGFVVPSNPDNSLSLDANFRAILKSHHERMLMEMGYYEDYTVDARGTPSFRTEVALRTALLSEDDCVEGSRACRRLTQFVNGQISGQRDEEEVYTLLAHILQRDLRESSTALEKLVVLENDALVKLTTQLWRDRVQIARLCLDYIHHSSSSSSSSSSS